MIGDHEEAMQAVHEALKLYLDEDEIPICWTLTIEVVGPNSVNYLAHRAGGGIDGTDLPNIWTVAGLLRGATIWTDTQLEDIQIPLGDDEDEDSEP